MLPSGFTSSHLQLQLLVATGIGAWQPRGIRIPSFEPNWVFEHDLKGFLHLAGFEAVRTHRPFLFPKMGSVAFLFIERSFGVSPGIPATLSSPGNGRATETGASKGRGSCRLGDHPL